MSEQIKKSSSLRSNQAQAKPAAPRTNDRPSGNAKKAPGVQKTVRSGSSAQAKPALQTTKQSAQAKPAPKKKPVKKKKAAVFFKKAGKTALECLHILGLVFVLIFSTVSSVFKAINKKFDVFRKSEATAVITNCAIVSVIASGLILAFLLVKPSMDASRALTLADKGQGSEAVRIIEKLERKGYNPEKLIEIKLSAADKLIGACQLDEAREILSSMEKTEKTNALSDKLNYHYAQSLYKRGEYSNAAQMFYQMPQYLDSLERYYDCRCALAIQAYLEGKDQQIQTLLMEIPDMANRVQNIVSEMTGGQDDEVSARIQEAFNEEKLKDFEQMVTVLYAAEKNVQKGRIAAGYCHTLGLDGNGNVHAAGDNMYGQCNVSEWSNVTQVAAGAYHSVALFADGTVGAVGDNSEKQLEVDAWTDIVAIAASAYDTIGLKADGSVVACGMHADLVSGWHGVTMISGGAHSMGCLYDKGYMIATHTGAQMDMSVMLFDLSVSGSISAGILHNGTLVTNFENAPEWTDIVSIEASSTGLFAINTEGKVLSHFFRPGDAVEFVLPSEAVEIASGGTHHVVLTKDGRVFSFGDNEFGQLNTEDWSL